MKRISQDAATPRNITAFVLLVLIVFVAHFLDFLHFGLYEDDYYFISGSWRTPEFLFQIKDALISWPQGRPIGFFLTPFFSFVGERLGGLHAIYAIGFLVVSLNACLFYILLKDVGSETLAVTGALAFSIFPADTTHLFLTHSLCLQVAMTFWLVGAHFYLSGRRVASYIAITASLLTYETPYLVFLAIPLLESRWNRALFKELFRHAGVLAGIILAIVVIRALMGEERVGGMTGEFPDILIKIAKSMIIGPAVSMLQFANAPIRALYNWNWQLTIISAAPLAAIMWMLRQSVHGSVKLQRNQAQFEHLNPHAKGEAAQDTGRELAIGQLYLAGIVMLCLAYVLSFTHYPPVASYGRATSVHLASALGGSLLFACIWSQVFSFANRFRLRSVAIIAFSFYLSLIVGYRLLIQEDFKRAWQNQRSFWTAAIDVLPDIRDGTVIFVVDKDLPKTQFILSNSWADPIILGQLFEFPAQWANPPRLFVVNRVWFKGLSRIGNHFRWMVPEASWESHEEVIPDFNVILLEMEGGKLVRKYGAINIDGLDFNLKTLPPGSRLGYERSPLFKYLINGAK